MPSRRDTLVLIGLSTASFSLPLFAQSSIDPETLLRVRLADLRLPFVPAHLTLMQATHEVDATGHRIGAVVQMTWSPGLRSQYFTGQGQDIDSAVSAVAMNVFHAFSAAAGLTQSQMV